MCYTMQEYMLVVKKSLHFPRNMNVHVILKCNKIRHYYT